MRAVVVTVLLLVAVLHGAVPVAAAPATSRAVPGAAGTPPLPECEIGDVITRYTDPADVVRSLVDWERMLPETYRPTSLVRAADLGFGPRGERLSSRIVPDLTRMVRAARRDGVALRVEDGYRSYARQERLFADFVEAYGWSGAVQRAARPGHSEHQLGTAIDFVKGGGAWTWLRRHAWRFGFVKSYPDGAQAEVCYRHEPWHYRWMGVKRASAIRESGQTLRRWLWERFETAD